MSGRIMRVWCASCGEDLAEGTRQCGCGPLRSRPHATRYEPDVTERTVRRCAALMRAGVPQWLAVRLAPPKGAPS